MTRKLSELDADPAAAERRRWLRRAGMCAAAALPAWGLGPRPVRAQPMPGTLRVGFVFVSPIGQAGWTFQHNQGRLELERGMGPYVKTRFVESVPEGADSERVLRDLAAQGHQLIFATSFGYLEPALRVAAEFPKVRFEHAGGHRNAPNLRTYNARYYEGRYLAGMLAGGLSARGVVGYVAGFPVPEVVQGLNAFALGLRETNPKAELRVLWLNAWFDPPRERDAAVALVNQGADVLSHHTGSPAVPQVAEARGVKLLAYQSDMSAFAPKAQVAAVTHHWGAHYLQSARSVLDGSWVNTPVWGGMREGLVRLTALSPQVPAPLRTRVEARREAIMLGAFRPFAGRLVDNTGRERQGRDAAMTDEQIAAMNWLVEGVIGRVPGR